MLCIQQTASGSGNNNIGDSAAEEARTYSTIPIDIIMIVAAASRISAILREPVTDGISSTGDSAMYNSVTQSDASSPEASVGPKAIHTRPAKRHFARISP
jgi:hypothetical protein